MKNRGEGVGMSKPLAWAGRRWAGALLGIVFLTIPLWGGCGGRPGEHEREGPGAAAAPKTAAGEVEGVVTINRAGQEQGGIVVKSLPAVSRRKEFRAYGRVLDLGDLIALVGRYATIRGKRDGAQAFLTASEKEYRRLEALNGDGQNISKKRLEQAEAAWRAAAAEARAEEESLQALESEVRQRWGAVLSKWLLEDSPGYRRLVRQHDVLVQVTLPSGERLPSGPGAVTVETAEGPRVSARLISPAPRTDPRIQGRSFFYAAPAKPAGLAAGMNVTVHVPVGLPVKGRVVPDSAVVWWRGVAWMYVQEGPGSFVRREVPAGTPLSDGRFVETGFPEGVRVVVRGAQLVLSEEFRAQVRVGEEGDED